MSERWDEVNERLAKIAENEGPPVKPMTKAERDRLVAGTEGEQQVIE